MQRLHTPTNIIVLKQAHLTQHEAEPSMKFHGM